LNNSKTRTKTRTKSSRNSSRSRLMRKAAIYCLILLRTCSSENKRKSKSSKTESKLSLTLRRNKLRRPRWLSSLISSSNLSSSRTMIWLMSTLLMNKPRKYKVNLLLIRWKRKKRMLIKIKKWRNKKNKCRMTSKQINKTPRTTSKWPSKRLKMQSKTWISKHNKTTKTLSSRRILPTTQCKTKKIKKTWSSSTMIIWTWSLIWSHSNCSNKKINRKCRARSTWTKLIMSSLTIGFRKKLWGRCSLLGNSHLRSMLKPLLCFKSSRIKLSKSHRHYVNS